MEIKNINITYFSGTGGTEKIAFIAQKYLVENNKTIEIHSINKNYLKNANISNDKIDLIILFFPVYAFDSPQIIYDWCKLLPKGNNLPVMVVSISGGGEVSQNSACRIGIMKKLKKKGYFVFYENMVKMPSNFLVETPEKEALKLIMELPNTIKTILDKALSGKERHKKPEFTGRVITFLLKIEKTAIWLFGKSLKVRPACTKCNWCVNNCPKNNIENRNDKIIFKFNCEGCLKCIYGCPFNVIYTKIFSFIILKNGYSIKELEEKI